MSRNDGSDSGSRADGATLDPRVLDDVIRRIVAVVQPERIILFGSAARGEMGCHLAQARACVPGAYLEDLCFGAQQAAEEALKAVLIFAGRGVSVGCLAP